MPATSRSTRSTSRRRSARSSRAATDLTADGTKLLTLGGDHTIALPLLRVMHALHGPLAVLHFDAHLDTWDTYFGEPYTHGTPFRRASEEGLLDRDHCLHVGIRGPLYGPATCPRRATWGSRPCTAWSWRRWASRVRSSGCGLAWATGRSTCRSTSTSSTRRTHPGTGTPEAGGLTSRELLGILRGLAGSNVVSADVVEVSPAYDHAEITGIAASHVAYELLSVLATGQQ